MAKEIEIIEVTVKAIEIAHRNHEIDPLVGLQLSPPIPKNFVPVAIKTITEEKSNGH